MSKVWFILVKVPADGNEEPGSFLQKRARQRS
jgi:hypothetical protein